MKDKLKLELEKLKIEYDHCEKLVWNVLWLVSLFCAFVITGILKDVIEFYTGVFIVCAVGFVVAILMIPVAKKSDDITNKKIPELMGKR